MTETTFSISTNKDEYCYDPMVCATNKGHLVVWAHSVETEQSTLWACTFDGRKPANAVKICVLEDQESILFLRRFSKNTFVLAVETLRGTTVYFMDENANVTDTQMYNSTDMVAYCCPTDEGVVLFTYNHEDSTMVVSRANAQDWNTDQVVMYTYRDVCGIPHVFVDGLYYIAGWITTNDTLCVASGTITTGGDGQITTLEPYDVDYLIAAVSDTNTVVYGGYDNNTNTIRLDFFRISDGEHIYSRYWKSNEYTGLQFSMASLNRGFMLLADGSKCDHVCGQRFTHIGSWLYPMRQLESSDEPNWSPSLARGAKETLLVYINDYDDYSQVWGKWLNVGDIPELEDITLENV